MKNKLGQEPAIGFTDIIINENISFSKNMHTGMSKRFYAACKIAQGFAFSNITLKRISNISDSDNESREIIIRESFKWADELLKQENENA